MTAAAPPLLVEGLAAGYGKQARVLDGIDLVVESGHIVGLLGLNGAGKTTLLKSILDFIALEAGGIALFGVGHRHKAARRNLAYLPEQFMPSPQLTGWEFLSLSLGYYGLRLARDRARDIGRHFGLDDAVLARRVTSYSKGMGQKLGLIATLLLDRPLLLLDEPMSGLDPLARARLKEALLAQRARGHSVFLSSHILADIDALCDRIAVIHDGTLRYDGTTQGLKAAEGEDELERAFLRRLGATPGGSAPAPLLAAE